MRPPPTLIVPPGLSSCRAVLVYDDGCRQVVTGLKNRGERFRITDLATEMAWLVVPMQGLVVTWAPTAGPRRRRRGFDHAELLARAIARRRSLPVRRLLRRLPGPAQEGRSLEERRAGPRFSARACSAPVLLVDDVATTGVTLSAAAAALRRAGAPAVHALVLARALPPGARPAADG